MRRRSDRETRPEAKEGEWFIDRVGLEVKYEMKWEMFQHLGMNTVETGHNIAFCPRRYITLYEDLCYNLPKFTPEGHIVTML